MLIYHATNEEKFNKKAFEYAFSAASRFAGRESRLNDNSVYPGADVIVEETRFSLKTEAQKKIKPNAIHVSKLMEGRWIRDYSAPEEYAHEAKKRIGGHLRKYERILVLRAFDQGELAVRYELVEIPRDLLLRIENLKAKDFFYRGKPSSGADVPWEDGAKAFRIKLDKSVEKVTISGLRKDLCRYHASWTIPLTVVEKEQQG